MNCEICGRYAPTKHVVFYQNIGMLIMRQTQTIGGHMCKSCIKKYFRQCTLTTFFLGWWGTISFVITPFLILNNVIRYLSSWGLEKRNVEVMKT